MPTAFSLVLWSVVTAQCAVYLFGLHRGRRETWGLVEALVCLSFATYSATHAATISHADGRTLLQVAHGLATIALLPGWIALAASLHPASVNRLRFAVAYSVMGALGMLVHQVGLDPDFLREPLTTRVGVPARSFDDLLAAGYLLGAILYQSATLVVLMRQPRLSSPSRFLTAALALVVVSGAHDLYGVALAPYPLAPWLDYALGLVALGCLDRAIRQIAVRGDALYFKTEELSRSYAELRSTQERLVRNEQLAAVGELSAVIAHEVRNPLAIIKNALSGLRRKTLRPADRGMLLDIVDEETDKLNRLMHDLLAYARPVAPRLADVDLNELLHRSVARACGGVTAPVGLDVKIDANVGGDVLQGDTELLVHAFVNIIENSLQAMPSGGTLDITTRRTVMDGRASIAVDISDTGEGMDTTVRAKARDPFFTTRPTGTGLGLAIVERVVRNHGGHIEIKSNQGDGTTVSISLPLDRHSLTPLPSPESSSITMVLPGTSL